MHGDALEFQRDAAHKIGLGAHLSTGQRFHRGAVAPRIGDAAVANDGLDQRRERERRAAQQECFDAAMLVAELNFQVMHLLAVAHKAEMSRLDHAGVDRTDPYLVDLLPAHLEKGCSAMRCWRGPS